MYQAVILCGGQGTRIRAVSEAIPKPLVEVGDKPIVWHIMKMYAHYGIRRFIMSLGHKGETIVDYFSNYSLRNNDSTIRFGGKERVFRNGGDHDVDNWEITFALTGADTMTGGRLRRIMKYIDQDVFFCTYGDGVADVNLNELHEFHRSRNSVATLTGVHLPTTFGIVEAGEDNTVTSFREKPVLPGFINGGFFVFNSDVFDFIDGDATVLEAEPFRALAKEGKISLFRHGGFWQCMDTYKDYETLNKMWKTGTAPWKVWAEEVKHAAL